MNTKLKFALFLAGIIVLLFCFGKNETKPNSSETMISEPEPETDIYFSVLPKDTTELLKLFFENGELISGNLIKWKPDLEEKLHLQVSEDGFCYSSLDTSIILNDAETEYLLLFETHLYDTNGTRYACHSCYPDYSLARVETDNLNAIKINEFNHHVLSAGGWGIGPEIELLNFGEEKKLLQFKSGHTGTGEENIQVFLVDANRLEMVLNFTAFQSNEMLIDDPYGTSKGLSKKETELTTEYNNYGSYDLILSEKKTEFDSLQERIITHYSTKVYRWNENDELELCYE